VVLEIERLAYFIKNDQEKTLEETSLFKRPRGNGFLDRTEKKASEVEICLQVRCNLKKHLQRYGSQARSITATRVYWSRHA